MTIKPTEKPDNRTVLTATVKERRFSSIWLLPIIALIIGCWFLVKAVIDAPIQITIQFDSGKGIVAGKTPVRYNGINVGNVTHLAIDWNNKGQGIIASVNIDRSFKKVLGKNTKFWLVKPEVSVKQVTGLDTLITGNYIALKFTSIGSDKTRQFTALNKAPDEFKKGSLSVILEAANAYSLITGDKILYKGIAVGKVLSLKLAKTADKVLIKAAIDPDYAPLVRTHSLFWKSSGIDIHFGLLSGLELKTRSLENIIQGGIILATPETNPGSKVKANHHFQLSQTSKSEWNQWSPKIKIKG